MCSPFFIFYFILLMQAGKCLPPYSLVYAGMGTEADRLPASKNHFCPPEIIVTLLKKDL
jgi:hypothetical protein